MFYGQPQSNPNQVYFDAESGRYYTQSSPTQFVMGHSIGGGERTFLDSILGQNKNSPVQKMLANRQPYQYNAPTAQQMFPGMQQPMMGGMQQPMQQPMQSPFGNMFGGMQSPSFNMGSMGQGNQGGIFGAGRFLGGQGLLGNSTSTTT